MFNWLATTLVETSNQMDLLDAVREQDRPDREDVAEYARQYGMDPDRALTMLNKFRQNGDVGGNHDRPFRVY